MKSIDDATPEDWNALRKPITHRKIMSNRLDKLIEEDFSADDTTNDHPVFGENIPDNSTKFDSVNRPKGKPSKTLVQLQKRSIIVMIGYT